MSDPSEYQPVPPVSTEYQPVQQPTPQMPPGQPAPGGVADSGLSDSAASGLAYFTFIPAIIFLIVAPYSQKKEVRFHAWQSIFLSMVVFLVGIGLAIVLGIASFILPHFLLSMLSLLIDLGWFALWLACVYNAFNGKRFSIPLVGDLAAKQA